MASIKSERIVFDIGGVGLVALGFVRDEAGVLHAPDGCRLTLAPAPCSDKKGHFEIKVTLPTGTLVLGTSAMAFVLLNKESEKFPCPRCNGTGCYSLETDDGNGFSEGC